VAWRGCTPLSCPGPRHHCHRPADADESGEPQFEQPEDTDPARMTYEELGALRDLAGVVSKGLAPDAVGEGGGARGGGGFCRASPPGSAADLAAWATL